jgi:hypothetical protein
MSKINKARTRKTGGNKLARNPKIVRSPHIQIKYFDTLVPGNMLLTINYSALTIIPQGNAQSQRIGDVIYPIKLDCRYSLSTANSDVFNTIRLVLFTWKQNNASVAPGTASVLESPTTMGPLSFYNYEGRLEYHILKDIMRSMSGTSAAPTIESNLVAAFTVPLSGKIVYNLGVTTGYNQIYLANISDSAVTPYPFLTMWFRLWYYDT